MQLTGYALTLVLQSLYVGTPLLQFGLLGRQLPTIEQDADHGDKEHHHGYKADYQFVGLCLLTLHLLKSHFLLQGLISHAELAQAPVYVALLDRVEHGICTAHKVEGFCLAPHGSQTSRLLAHQPLRRHQVAGC